MEYSPSYLEYLHEYAEVFEDLINSILLGAVRHACASEIFSRRILLPIELLKKKHLTFYNVKYLYSFFNVS